MLAQTFSQLDLTAVAVLSVIGLSVAIVGVPTIAIAQWRAYRQRQMAAELVRDMLAQGMSAPDIESVLLAWSADSDAVAKIYRRRQKDEDKQRAAMKSPKGFPLKPPIAG